MTGAARDLLSFFEGYYGEKYSGVFLEVTAAYLENRPPEFYRAAADVVVRRFSRAYGKSPCVAEFEKHLDEIERAMPEPECLPEPAMSITDEERAERLAQLEEFRRAIGRKGPMSGHLANTLAV